MTQKKITFKLVYLVFLTVMVALVLAATLYVRNLLTDYEAAQPQRQAEAVMEVISAGSEAAGRAALRLTSLGAFRRFWPH